MQRRPVYIFTARKARNQSTRIRDPDQLSLFNFMLQEWRPKGAAALMANHSHSIVPGGFDVMSYTTRLIPRTSFTIRFEIFFIRL